MTSRADGGARVDAACAGREWVCVCVCGWRRPGCLLRTRVWVCVWADDSCRNVWAIICIRPSNVRSSTTTMTARARSCKPGVQEYKVFKNKVADDTPWWVHWLSLTRSYTHARADRQTAAGGNMLYWQIRWQAMGGQGAAHKAQKLTRITVQAHSSPVQSAVSAAALFSPHFY